MQTAEQLEAEVYAEYLRLAEPLSSEWVGQPHTANTIEGIKVQCQNIERQLNHQFSRPGHEYEVLLYLNEESRWLEMGYRLKSTLETLPELVGFTRLLPYKVEPEPVDTSFFDGLTSHTPNLYEEEEEKEV